jgi:hypothetical protein
MSLYDAIINVLCARFTPEEHHNFDHYNIACRALAAACEAIERKECKCSMSSGAGSSATSSASIAGSVTQPAMGATQSSGTDAPGAESSARAMNSADLPAECVEWIRKNTNGPFSFEVACTTLLACAPAIRRKAERERDAAIRERDEAREALLAGLRAALDDLESEIKIPKAQCDED